MPSLKALLDVLHVGTTLSTPQEVVEAVELIQVTQELNATQRDVLKAAFTAGPLDEGDVPSKSGRDDLLAIGFLHKVVVKGEDGFNACSYDGARAYRLIAAGA